MLKIHNLSIALKDERTISEILETDYALKTDLVKNCYVMQRSIDARKKNDIRIVYSLGITGNVNERKLKKILGAKLKSDIVDDLDDEKIAFGTKKMVTRPIIIGMGPCGLFAALYLARNGYCPIILERGRSVEERAKDVVGFWSQQDSFSSASNVQFGEGGAGTFSDGKLTNRNKDFRVGNILKDLVKAGAPEDILYQKKPHVGTDILRKVLIVLRKELVELGADIYFEEQLTELISSDGELKEIKSSKGRNIKAEVLILAIGHSARDTYRMLTCSGLVLEPKPFAIGYRIEHPQSWLNEAQYGALHDNPKLGAAEYMLSHKAANGRGVYSFCMCPGGQVVASTSEEGCVVTNGMSFRSRSLENANSALVATITPADWGGTVLGGIELQLKWEQEAYKMAGSNYFAPIQTVGSFLGKKKEPFLCKPTYLPGVQECDLTKALPDVIVRTIQEGIVEFGNKINGFDHSGAILTGVETRTSSPIRIIRDESGESISMKGIYPSGEGAGYAGGIISAALDGIRQAEKIMRKYQPIK